LTLLIGPMVPVPVPKPITDALTGVQINTGVGEPGGFQLTFSFSNRSPLNTLLLLLGKVGPYVRVVVVATMKGFPNVLADGVMRNNQVTPNIQTGQSVLTVSCTDLTAVLDNFDFSGIPYPAMPAPARVALILSKYAFLGLIPLVIPSIFFDVPLPTNAIPSHSGTDLSYIKMLAEEVGYVFYIEPGPAPGTNIAYWGPEIRIGPVQAALNANMDVHSNVESVNFSMNGDEQAMPIVFIQNEQTRVPIPIPIPNVSLLNPPLGLIPPIPSKFPLMANTSNLSPVKAIARGLAAASRSSDAVTCTGTLNVVRYGHILKARSLVGMRGASDAFNGLYFVKNVTHSIKQGEFKQNFTLVRNGLISTLPVVPT
jgi:hypothetical protein